MSPKNRLERAVLHCARFVLEADSAFSIAAGLSDGAFDNTVVRDANNLPTIPGTTIAGVLRHLLQREGRSEHWIEQLFGYGKKKKEQGRADDEEGAASCVEFSWGMIHNSQDLPVEGLQVQSNDDLLAWLVQDHPIHRDRVAINRKGVAEDQKKFDRTVLPKGCRFSFEMRLWADEKQVKPWKALLKLLRGRLLRFGGATRSGLGQFSCVRLHERIFDLREVGDYQRFQALSPSIGDTDGWADVLGHMSGDAARHDLTVTLVPEDFWRFGQGATPLGSEGNTVHGLPYTEPVLVWDNNTVRIVHEHVVVPGSSIKGAFRHRLTFHYARQVMAEKEGQPLSEGGRGQIEDNVRQLFGYAADTAEGKQAGQAGLIRFADLYIDANALNGAVKQMTHTSIDRFTGGVRHGVLYTEELIWHHPLTIGIDFDVVVPIGSLRAAALDKKMADALQWTLEDLVEGRLSLGAAASKGHGYFSGKMTWHKKPEWLGQGEEGEGA